ncbi:DNA-3-methyladenine glycosylase I, partial [Streptococcus mutans]|nr:DNA-3-methyladenine glycosylase I [Streptococcus mutans]
SLSVRLAKQSKKLCFISVVPVCIYYYLQSTGIINEYGLACDFNPKK